MKQLSLAIATCAFVAGSFLETGFPEFLFTVMALFSACAIKE